MIAKPLKLIPSFKVFQKDKADVRAEKYFELMPGIL
jgi:hypothetical protein